MELDQGAVWSSGRQSLRQIKDGRTSARLGIVQGGSSDDHLGYRGSNIMIARLTVAERQSALFILILMSVVGLAMAVAGRGTPFGLHGFLVIAFCVAIGMPLLRKFDAPEPAPA